jgi:hypothetical protein
VAQGERDVVEAHVVVDRRLWVGLGLAATGRVQRVACLAAARSALSEEVIGRACGGRRGEVLIEEPAERSSTIGSSVSSTAKFGRLPELPISGGLSCCCGRCLILPPLGERGLTGGEREWVAATSGVASLSWAAGCPNKEVQWTAANTQRGSAHPNSFTSSVFTGSCSGLNISTSAPCFSPPVLAEYLRGHAKLCGGRVWTGRCPPHSPVGLAVRPTVRVLIRVALLLEVLRPHAHRGAWVTDQLGRSTRDIDDTLGGVVRVHRHRVVDDAIDARLIVAACSPAKTISPA